MVSNIEITLPVTTVRNVAILRLPVNCAQYACKGLQPSSTKINPAIKQPKKLTAKLAATRADHRARLDALHDATQIRGIVANARLPMHCAYTNEKPKLMTNCRHVTPCTMATSITG